MALDGAFLRHIKQELEGSLLGARVDKIHQPNREELVVAFRTREAAYRVLFSARANSARVHFTTIPLENPKQPPMLCMLLRKKLLGVDELHFYDLYVPMVGDVDMHFTYEEACDLILKALEPMGEEYCSIVRQGLVQRWIDVYENPGKRSGAYSAGGYSMHPFILLNFQGTLNDVFTLIHEMGHSMHTYLSCANQPSCYSDYVIFVAEVASTCNEALLMQYLLKTTTDKRQRAYLINYFLEQFRTTLYRQTMFAEFELEVNRMTERGEGLTADALCAIHRKLNADYFGPDIVVDEEISLEWARIPHFYYNYYVYQYSTGYAAAIALSQKILQEGKPAVEHYLNFLKGGCSKPPIDLLRGAGVDMATAQPIDEALKLFDGLLEEMDELVK